MQSANPIFPCLFQLITIPEVVWDKMALPLISGPLTWHCQPVAKPAKPSSWHVLIITLNTEHVTWHSQHPTCHPAQGRKTRPSAYTALTPHQVMSSRGFPAPHSEFWKLDPSGQNASSQVKTGQSGSCLAASSGAWTLSREWIGQRSALQLTPAINTLLMLNLLTTINYMKNWSDSD